MIHRYRRRWLKKNLRPCPINCQSADIVGKSRVVGCGKCGSRNPDVCAKEAMFEPLYSKEELYEQFRERIRNPEILLREYRDIAALLWVMGGFDEEIDETVISGVEVREKPQANDTVNVAARPAPGSGNSIPGQRDNEPKSADPRPIRRLPKSGPVSSGNR